MHNAHTYSTPSSFQKKIYKSGAGPGLCVHHAGHHPGAQEGRDDPTHLENKQSHRE